MEIPDQHRLTSWRARLVGCGGSDMAGGRVPGPIGFGGQQGTGNASGSPAGGTRRGALTGPLGRHYVAYANPDGSGGGTSPRTSAVARKFDIYLREWQNALKEWTQWCKAGQEERRTLQATGGLVAQASTVSPRRATNPTLSDAPRVPGPPGLTSAAEDRLKVLEQRSAKCDEVIGRIKRVIAALDRAQQTGEWSGDRLEFSVFAEKRFISRVVAKVSRGEGVEVLEIAGDWWRIRTLKGIKGWVHRAHLEPQIPVQLWEIPNKDSPGPHAPPEDRSGGLEGTGRG